MLTPLHQLAAPPARTRSTQRAHGPVASVRSTAKLAVRMLLGLAIGVPGCDMAAPPKTASDVHTDLPATFATICATPAPTCLSACNDGVTAAAAECSEGAWRCPIGIRADLCCDAILHPERCEPWGAACDPTHPCPTDYTCVAGHDWPLQAAAGVCRFGDWSVAPEVARCDSGATLTWADALPTYARPAAIQVEGVVRVTPVCDDGHCDAANPCCQQCSGSYTFEMVRSDGSQAAIALRTQALACAGTNCGYSCAPLQPGRRYRLWGLWFPPSAAGDVAEATGMMYLIGHCED